MKMHGFSDEDYLDWVKGMGGDGYSMTEIVYPRDAWNECRRRADLLTQCMNDLHEAIVEERERKAFEAGWIGCHEGILGIGSIDCGEAYRTYKEKHP